MMTTDKKNNRRSGARKRLARISPWKKLAILWKEATKEDLIWLVMKSEQESVQEKAWRKLKTSGELMLSDMYDLIYGPEFIQEELSKMFLEEADPEDLFGAMDSSSTFADKAEIKLFRLLEAKNLRIHKGRARSILLKIIEWIPPSREKAFKRFLELGPSQTDLRRILDMEFIKRDPITQVIIEKLIRKLAKKDHGNKRVQKMERLERKLRKTKKEQN